LSKTILLIDGDIFCYRYASIAEERSVLCTHKSSGRTKTFVTKTEFKNFLKAKGFEYKPEDYELKENKESLGVSLALGAIKQQIELIKARTFADEVRCYISGKDNFRDTLPLPSKYKGHRENTPKPLHLKDCREYLKKHHAAKECHTHEADDALVIDGYEILRNRDLPIIVTIDKDIMQSSGLSVYRFTDSEPVVHKISDFGFLNYESGKTTGEGFLWLCYQWLRGDPTDNFNPSELAKVKWGDMAGYKLLHDAKDHKEALERVIQQYKSWYPKITKYKSATGVDMKADWKTLMTLYYKCCRMRQHKDDLLDPFELFKEHEVEI
jgi:hypothetical protein